MQSSQTHFKKFNIKKCSITSEAVLHIEIICKTVIADKANLFIAPFLIPVYATDLKITFQFLLQKNNQIFHH